MTDRSPGERLRGLSSLVGNTPLLAIECEYRGARRVVHAKAEHLNLSGSIKDRMAMHILRQGYASVGCWPCTRRTPPGTDPRAGRWPTFDKTECGIHR